ncbi:MAG TPA: LUD domain-containing protein [bacterium]
MQNLRGKITKSLSEVSQRNALLSAVKRGRDARAQALSAVPDSEHFRDQIKSIKERCIQNLEALQAQFIENAKARGATVILARTGEEACNYVLELAKKKNAKLISKSKSLTTEEIELNHPLQDVGIRVVETDLGEYIIQLAGELPYHLVFPAVHKTAEQVAELFSRATGEAVSSDLGDIMKLMRQTLRPIFLDADIGITGGNVAIAETGSLLIETNEGNGRLVSAIPPVQVAVVGVEKIVATIDDALQMIRAHPISATGQPLTTYVSIFAGRAPLGNQEDREFHIVLLDNGRLRMRDDPGFREALHCIRCGACMNICPTYGVLGGHVFGHIYPGPIGIPWTAQVHGLENAAKFSDLCISCGLCKEICPAAIDIPMMIARVKNEILKTNKQPLVNKVLMASETFARIACATAPVSNWILHSRTAKLLSEKILGLDRRRRVPIFKRRTFKKQFAKEKRNGNGDANKVALFVDYANYVAPELLAAAARILRSGQAHVALPDQKTSGYPFISYGELQRAARYADFNVQNLFPFVEQGYDIVAIEPTAVYSLKQIYPKLLNDLPAARAVANRTFEFFDYIQKLQQDGYLLIPPQITDGRRFGYHLPCHQRGLSAGNSTLRLLKSLGYDVTVIETGTCCGMAGTFGLKTGPLGYDLSVTVGEPLFQLFRDSEVEVILTESSVCSLQLCEGTGLPVLHPLELIASLAF